MKEYILRFIIGCTLISIGVYLIRAHSAAEAGTALIIVGVGFLLVIKGKGTYNSSIGTGEDDSGQGD